MTEGLGVALVGLGNAGRQHLAAANASNVVRCVAAVEPDAAAAAGVDVPIGTLDSVLSDARVRVVAVCTPPGLREPIVRAAFAAGKHVLVEKPPARDSTELEALLRAGADAGRLSAVMFQHRFALPEELRTSAAERFAGAAATLVVSRQRSDAHYREGGWRSQPSLALGGVTSHLGVHYLDLACQLLGTPVEVTPLSRTDAAEGIDVQLSAHVAFDSGARLNLMVTSRASARLEHLAVLGERDWIEIRDGVVTAHVDGETVERSSRPAVQLRAEVYQELCASVCSGRTPPLSALARSRGVVAVLDGMAA